jgi:anti-sigma regulatory factor (Ser/Thr protein kinase)
MEFIFHHSTDALLPFLIETGQHIENILPQKNAGQILLHKCKFILTELCTNGIKHSGQPHSIFNIHVEHSDLVIERKDYGLPFHAGKGRKDRLLLPHDVTGTVMLTEDDINRLNMQRIDEHSVRFFVEDVSEAYQPTNQTLNEHFGLIIICRSSTKFTYSRLPDGLNVFAVFISIL